MVLWLKINTLDLTLAQLQSSYDKLYHHFQIKSELQRQKGVAGGELGRYYCDLSYEIPTTALVCVISELTPNNKQTKPTAILPAACDELIACFRFKHEIEDLGAAFERLLICSVL